MTDRLWGVLVLVSLLGPVAADLATAQRLEKAGVALRAQGQTDAAAATLRAAVREAPDYAPARAALAETYLQAGHHNLAFAAVADAMKAEGRKAGGNIGPFVELMARVDMDRVDPDAAAAEAARLEQQDLQQAPPAPQPQPQPQVQPQPQPAAPRPVANLPWATLSEYQDAAWPSLAVGPDGVWHAAWQDKRKDEIWTRLFYSRSTDGVTWSEPEVLSDGTRDDYIDVVKMVVDGAGRPSIFYTHPPASTVGPSGYTNSNLFVISGGPGAWSEPARIGAEDGVFGWFACADPNGGVHAIYSRDLRDKYHSQFEAGTIDHVVINGGAVGPARTLVSIPKEEAPGVIRNSGFTHLTGTVAADGTVHWLALRQDFNVGTLENAQLVIGRDGELGSLGQVTDTSGWTLWMPTLAADAQGRIHVLLYSRTRREGQALLDVLPYENAEQRVIFETPDDLKFIRYDVSNSRGTMAITMVAETTEGRDLYLTTSDGGPWSELRNVTDNAARTALTDGPAATALTKYSARSASVAVAPDGTMGVLMHNGATTYVAGMGAYGGHVVDRVYFTRF